MELNSLNDQQASSRLKVLIADDDTPTRILLRAAISQWGYEVIEASDGEMAWELTQNSNQAPDLLIVDWLMPKLDGVALCERIKRELTNYPYIILLTQVTGTTNIIKGLDAGADEFLSKPFNMAELRSRLSVGARIVKYKNMVAQKNKQLQEYVENIKILENSIASLCQQVEEWEKSPEKTISLSQLKEIINKIKYLHTLVQSILVKKDE